MLARRMKELAATLVVAIAGVSSGCFLAASVLAIWRL
jgi:hypothetical protein